MGDTIFNLYVWSYSTLLSNQSIEAWLLFSETFFTFAKDSFYYSYATNYTFIFTAKIATCLIFLAAIRGGVPRYRYDFLTKMGWVKFLGLVLSIFVAVFFLHLLW